MVRIRGYQGVNSEQVNPLIHVNTLEQVNTRDYVNMLPDLDGSIP